LGGKGMKSKKVYIFILTLLISAVIVSATNVKTDFSNYKSLSVFYSKLDRIELMDNGPEEEWNRTFGGELFDNGYGVEQTNDGGYIVSGSKDETGSYEGGDCWLIKTDESGNIEWDNTYGGPENDKGWAVRQTNDGGYAVVGVSNSFSPINHDIYFVKTDPDGDLLWQKIFGSEGIDSGLFFQMTSDGGYIIFGTNSWDPENEKGDAWGIKTNVNGDEIWNKTYGGADMELGYSIQQTSDSGYIMAIGTNSYGAGDFDAWLIKTDAFGNIQWDQTYGGVGLDYCVSVLITNDGGFIFVGATTSHGDDNGDVWLVKTDENGNMQWEKTYGGDGIDYGYHLDQTDDGGFLIVGGTDSFGAGNEDFYVIKTDSSGNMIWDKTLGGENKEICRCGYQTDDGGYIISGLTYSYGSGESDVWLVKLAPYSGENIDIEIHGGFRVSADIVNSGVSTAKNVGWSIKLDGGLIIFGKEKEGTISELKPNIKETVNLGFLFGFGRNVDITVKAGIASKKATASWILGPLVLGVTDIS
jgi:hypothetical protein